MTILQLNLTHGAVYAFINVLSVLISSATATV